MDDRASIPGAQEMMIEMIKESNSDVLVKEINASHSPMLSKPAEIATLVDEAVMWFV